MAGHLGVELPESYRSAGLVWAQGPLNRWDKAQGGAASLLLPGARLTYQGLYFASKKSGPIKFKPVWRNW